MRRLSSWVLRVCSSAFARLSGVQSSAPAVKQKHASASTTASVRAAIRLFFMSNLGPFVCHVGELDLHGLSQGHLGIGRFQTLLSFARRDSPLGSEEGLVK